MKKETTKPGQNAFLVAVLKEANKTETDILTEKVTNFLETSIIDCEQQIAEREVSLKPRKILELKKALLLVDKVTKQLETAGVTIPNNGKFETYFNDLIKAETALVDANNSVISIQGDLNTLDKEIAKLQEVLLKLK